MRPLGVLRWALLGLCVVVALGQDSNNVENNTENTPVVPENTQEALAEVKFEVEVIQECLANPVEKAETGGRTKRGIYSPYRTYPLVNGVRDYLGLGLTFRRFDYQYFPNILGYDSRFSAYYPEDLRINIYSHPVARFFNSFYPGPIERPAEGIVTRTYFRNGGYTQALADFRLFPLQNVRTLTTTTTTRTAVSEPGYVGVFNDFPYEVRVCPDCCVGGDACITFTGQTFPYRQVVRNFVYSRSTRTVRTGYNTVYPVV